MSQGPYIVASFAVKWYNVQNRKSSQAKALQKEIAHRHLCAGNCESGNCAYAMVHRQLQRAGRPGAGRAEYVPVVEQDTTIVSDTIGPGSSPGGRTSGYSRQFSSRMSCRTDIQYIYTSTTYTHRHIHIADMWNTCRQDGTVWTGNMVLQQQIPGSIWETSRNYGRFAGGVQADRGKVCM